MVEINQNICIGCGACVSDCLAGAIELEAGKAQNIGPCILCGHCVAVCPVQAVSIPEYEMQDVEEYTPDSFRIKPENMLHTIKFRRSIRRYTQAKIEEFKVRDILAAGRYTATAKNQQACTFVFVQDKLEEFKELVWMEMPGIIKELHREAPRYGAVFNRFYEKHKQNPRDDNLFYNCPAFLVIAGDNHPLDAGLAAANIENMAVAHDLGALYSGYLMRVVSGSRKLREWLGMEEKPVACCMLIGYPAVTYKRTAPRRKGDIILK